MQLAVRLGMNTGKQRQRIDVGEQAVEEILADARLLLLLKRVAFEQVSFCRAGDPDFHQCDLI
jgi:hypothetical protein